MMKPLLPVLTGAILVAALLLPTSCSKEDINAPGGDHGKQIAVNFLAPQISAEVEANGASWGKAPTTRANVALGEEATVRVIAFGNITADANPSPNNYVAEQTYYMKSGVLTPCTVDDTGKFKAETPNAALTLPAGVYTFYTISPALPHKREDNTVVVTNGLDYAASQTSEVKIAHGMTPVTLIPLAHQCVRLKLVVKKADGSSLTTLKPYPNSTKAVVIGGLQPTVMTRLGETIPVGSGEEILTIRDIAFSRVSDTHYETQEAKYILPATSGRITLIYDLACTDSDGDNVKRIVEVSLAPGSDLTPGKSYLITLSVDKMTRTVTVTPIPWEDKEQDVEMGTPPKASYVEQGKYIVTPDVYGTTASFHAIWLDGTPAHRDNEYANNSISRKLQLAKNDVNSGATLTLADAINACAAYIEEGGGWRIPTKKEAFEAFGKYAELTAITRLADENYWTSTQTTNPEHSYGYWYVRGTGSSGYDDGPLNDGTIKFRTRCVRDIGSRLPADYPYVQDGKYIVSRDEEGTTGGLHGNWSGTLLTLLPPTHTDADAMNTVPSKLEVASGDKTNVSYNASYDYCTTYSQDGGGWRLPTIKELQMIYRLKSNLTNTPGYPNYWSSTLSSANSSKGWYLNNNNGTVIEQVLTAQYSARCVRDVFPIGYPYVQNGNTIVVKDANGSANVPIHPKWTLTPSHTDARLDLAETVAAKFEVAASNAIGAASSWGSTNADCPSGWRRPNNGELRLMMAFKDQLTYFPSTSGATYYWSATEALESGKAYRLAVNSSDNTLNKQLKADNNKSVRCVKDVD